MRYTDPELVSRLAAEYVLGTLTGSARARFRALSAEREDIRRQVEAWEQRLGDLVAGVAEVPPPPVAWQSIAARVAPIAAVQEERGILERLGFWRRLAATACAACALVLAVWLWPGSRSTPPENDYVVLVRDDTQRAIWVINTLAGLAELEVTAAASMDVPAGKSCYLWVKPETPDRFYALGLLPESGSSRIPVRDELREFLPGRLVVSMEDASAPIPAEPASPMEMSSEWCRSIERRF